MLLEILIQSKLDAENEINDIICSFEIIEHNDINQIIENVH